MNNQFESLLKGAEAQARSIYAVMIRDMMLRFGRNNLGFLWIMVEPMLLTIGVLVIFSLIKSGPQKDGIQIIPMVLSGYMPLTMWRHTSNSGVSLFRRASGLLYHRNVTVFDAFIGRLLIEGIGTTGALVAVYSALLALDLVPPLADLGLLLTGWSLLWWYGTAAALIIAALTEYDETWEKFMGPFQYLMVPLSGVFFLVDWLPYEAQQIIGWNPLTNCVEFFRAGFFGSEIETHYYPGYVVLVNLFLTASGLWLLDLARSHYSGR